MSAQQWDPERYARQARFVSDLGKPVLDLLAPRPRETILDLGCGDGALTQKLVALGCDVLGIDSSAPQVEAAKGRGLKALVMDGQQLHFNQQFDAVFTNAALHWMKRTDDVIAGVRRALKTEGRFVGEFGGYGCVNKIVTALYAALEKRGIRGSDVNPWYFPTIEDYQARLERHGFRLEFIALIPRPTPLPEDLTGWLETFAESFTSTLPVGERSSFLQDVQESLRPHLCDVEGRWTADYVRLRFDARVAKRSTLDKRTASGS